MSVLKRIVNFFYGDTIRMIADFRATFPGKCMICSLHRYGLAEGMTSETAPKPHKCIELSEPHPADYDSPAKYVAATREWERTADFVKPMGPPSDKKPACPNRTVAGENP